MALFKIPVTLTISCEVAIEAATADGAVTLLKTSLDFNGDEFADCEGLLFDDSDTGIEVTNAALTAEPSLGAAEEITDEDETSEPEATPPTETDLK